MSIEIKLPDLGDNIDSGTVVSVFVSEGDSIEEDQALIELETDKAVIEVPTSSAGVVTKISVKNGDEVKIGQVIVELETNGQVDNKEEAKTEVKEETKPVEEPVVEAEPEPVKNVVAKQSSVPSSVDFKIPNMGDNVDSGTVTSILVNIGDAVEVDQGLVELETDKAVIEVPSDAKGVIKEILIKDGVNVAVGQKIMVIDAVGASEKMAEPATAPAAPKQEAVETKSTVKEETRELVHDPISSKVFDAPKNKIAPASPSVRRFAREIGLDIHEVPGTGPGGRISVEDVKSFSKLRHQQKGAGQTVGSPVQAIALPDFSKYGETEKEGLNKLRQTSAKNLTYAWSSIPHVSQFDKADITNLEKLRKTNGKKAEARGGKLTMTAILVKVIEAALRKFPAFNASIDMANNEIIYKKYFNIGIAVDTERGLLVPVIKDVEKKNIIDIAVEMTEISQKAHDKKLGLDEMQGGNFTISNLGGIGGTGFTPIVNSPEVAILGVSRAEMQPKYIDGNFEPRLVMPLVLSYDHRVIDGAAAARFLRWVCEVLEEPFNVLLEG
ncbi:MAG: dihydrolipoyllysine-residue acetyltransferase [Calditrichaeota bacterium]|nr:MAG: dihydrolipoyllysine-residue acetyltransferase [Calditrichota bacterium]MBL1204843.1 dihydrolipoyllysine-residue acetyltransferase [Calditrichota bacterium]NOG44672.1 dihydrolipoyllysine-residue acetyltransferase [Calditrichota bacterium]